MRFASSITTCPDTDAAVAELLNPVDAQVTPGMVDLLLLFVSAHFEDDLPEIIEQITAAMPNAALLGCSAAGTLGSDRAVQHGPSMSLLVGSLPDVHVRPFRVEQHHVESAKTSADWERIVAVAPENNPTFIALGDPFRISIHGFVERINRAFPGAPLVGGVASAGHAPLQNRLYINDQIFRDGIVGVALTGDLVVETVLSQGCRPIGETFVVTKSHKNVVHELGGHPALERLHKVFVGLSEEDEKLARQSLFFGRVIDEYKSDFSRGDFLIHNIIGVDRKSGAIGIAGIAQTGSTMQFHVRDAASADEDLREMLAPYAGSNAHGAMLFGCNGRGTQMWPTAGHDIGTLHEVLGPIPTAGFFCGGEFGPIGNRNFVHGFTASIALFQEPERDNAGSS